MSNKIKYLGYWSARKRISSESASVGLWDIWNKTKFEKKVEKGQSTSEEVARDNHKNNLGYEFCVFNEGHQEYPFAYVTIVPDNKHVGVNFIDPAGRKYLTYSFHEVKEDRTLFIQEIWYHHFTSETSENEDYRIHFVFDEDGNVNYRIYNEIEQKIQDYESKEPMDVKCLYEKYPEFGEYESILKVERPCFTDNFNLPNLKKKDSLTTPYKIHEGKDYTQEEWEKYESEQWKKFKDKE